MTRDPFSDRGVRDDLGGSALRGASASAASQIARTLIQILVTVVLARLLTPEDYGVFAMATVLLGFVAIFREMGLTTATVQHPSVDSALVSTMFWINTALGLALAAVGIALAPAIAWFFGDPRLVPVTMVLACGFVVTGMTAQHEALIQRAMRMSTLARVEITGTVLAGSVTVLLAWMGKSYWSLVIGDFAGAVVVLVGVWLAVGWCPQWPRRGTGARRLVRFGFHLTTFSFIAHFARQIDKVLIGWVWGPHVLGIYSRAYQLAMLPVHQFNGAAGRIGMPALARLQDDPPRFRHYYLTFVRVTCYLTLPPFALLLAVSDPVILLLLGEGWADVQPVFRLMVAAALLQPVLVSTGWVYVALGQVERMRNWGTLFAGIQAAVFAACVWWGAEAMAAAYAVTILALAWPMLAVPLRDTTMTVADVLRAGARPLGVGIMVAAFSSAWLWLIPEAGPWPAVVGATVASAATVSALYFSSARVRADIGEIAGFVRRSVA